MRTITSRRAITALAASCAAAALAVTPAGAAPADLAATIDGDAVNRHLIAFQRIADQNGGNRASGQPGYEASVDYVVDKLRRAGFDVTTPEFTYEAYFEDSSSLSVGGQPTEGDVMEYSPSTPEGGLTAPLSVLPVDDTPGCEATDYDGTDVTGTVVLIQRGACDFAVKQQIAADAGAVGAIIYNNVEGALNGTLGDADAGRVPTVGVTKEVGEALAGQAGAEVQLDIQARLETVTTRNVIAQTKTGRTDNVVMAGAHLDGVPDGPGINDNATGSAGLLETALKMGGSPDVENAVRFAWWGAEESGLVGSTKYVQSLTFEQQLDIALYVNFDMIGSPNAGYFVYDGDGSTGGPEGPQGSGQIKEDFLAAMAEQGIEAEPSEFNGRSDYGEFIAVGIPSGGMHTGVEDLKTEEQAAKWGGTAGIAFDPNYHAAGDDLSNVDRVALERMTKGIAEVVQAYAQSTEAVNGMQSREERAELRAAQATLMAQSTAQAPKVGHGHDLS
ncbi:M28 family metallopeptidase [Saccharopolyspora hordei]|uniref:Zn-dependent M28 family amino/carboxypeptidase n=1 Tax=Saccharopolyspora hordei TaxID=1838 RepID=A0A853ABW1_9PSEU|nr:Zn-dependent M28 family amino/carboxypeptidase [Saccharopolyspora hordei]